MSIEISWVGVAVVISILAHAFATIRYAVRIGVQLENLNDSIRRLDKELEKRDIQISAIWKKLDDIKEKVYGIAIKND